MLLSTIAATSPIEENLQQFLLIISAALIVATISQIVPWLRQVPYTLMLVVTGMGLALLDVRFFTPSPELILWIFLPPLLFEAAWNLNWQDLKRDLGQIAIYVTIGVAITIGGIALPLVHWSGISLPVALLIGACLAATDPVSVSALLKELGAPPRLKALVEGESMFNDGTAVVAFSLMSGIAMGTDSFNPQNLLVNFLTVVGVGLLVGLLLGFGISYLTQRFDLPLVEQSLTLVTAYSAYLIAEKLGGSGVIATVAAGLILGNFGSRIGMNPRTRVAASEFWEFVAFFANSILFLLIGAQFRFNTDGADLALVGIAFAAVLLTRVVVIYGLTFFNNRLTQADIDLRTQTMLWWSGLRGGVALALALSVSEELPERHAVLVAVFGVVFLTTLLQGATAKPVLEALKLIEVSPLRDRYLELISRQAAMSRVLDYLQQSASQAGIEPATHQAKVATVRQKLALLQEESHKLCQQDPDLLDIGAQQLQRDLFEIEARTYTEFVRSGRLTQELPGLLDPVNQHIADESELPEPTVQEAT
ncbi:cation:proton antiporter [Pantanalinema sp. GBBB05]|uniref:cation:proton antiporter n=1 Tax=Pantanalinema sp. GBBB05 TaxID=2604139 RepID=UPI001D92546C|nr:sodium:proton antiporter [Pantanalinema sp. GBBB05]